MLTKDFERHSLNFDRIQRMKYDLVSIMFIILLSYFATTSATISIIIVVIIFVLIAIFDMMV